MVHGSFGMGEGEKRRDKSRLVGQIDSEKSSREIGLLYLCTSIKFRFRRDQA